MDTRFLDSFLEVVDRGSQAEAARHLGISPAAVAQRMQALEAEIGVPLFIRVGRRVQPSEAGRAIYAQCRRIVGEVRSLRGLAQSDATVGELRLGAISTALTGLLPPALRWLKQGMPQLDLFLLPGTSPELFRQLTEDRIDAAIVVRPPFELAKTYNWCSLRHEPLRLICPADMAVTDLRETLRREPFIRYDRNNWGGRLVEGWLRREGLRPREWLELDSLDAIAVMVSSGLGIAIVPDWARPWPEGLALQVLPLPGPETTREIGAVWPRGSGAERLVQAMLTGLRAGG